MEERGQETIELCNIIFLCDSNDSKYKIIKHFIYWRGLGKYNQLLFCENKMEVGYLSGFPRTSRYIVNENIIGYGFKPIGVAENIMTLQTDSFQSLMESQIQTVY